jgi:hypothetical protein
VLREWLLLLYCVAIGFVASGVAASFFKMAMSKPAAFAMLGEGALAAATTLIFCAVSGPAIIIDIALKGRLPNGNLAAWVAGCFLVAGIWSACSGVILVEIVYVTTGQI